MMDTVVKPSGPPLPMGVGLGVRASEAEGFPAATISPDKVLIREGCIIIDTQPFKLANEA
ncbi:MAG: hypothetical protein RLZZ597_2479, partial [Cyanobacteriota bacterium]